MEKILEYVLERKIRSIFIMKMRDGIPGRRKQHE